MGGAEGAAGCLFGTVATVTALGTLLLFVNFFFFGLDPLGCRAAPIPSLSDVEEVPELQGTRADIRCTAFGAFCLIGAAGGTPPAADAQSKNYARYYRD